ncbi:MAG: LpqN/LpqT family lipoprotein [Mycobacteriaceae bacterium]|nr:LpqN/LpqT family lipoprotein [Mycobacteriaceae bacterium]
MIVKDPRKAALAAMGVMSAGIAVVICLASPAAVAEPMPAPVPAPVTVTQTVTVAPMAAAPIAAAPVPQAAAPVVPVAAAPLVPQAAQLPQSAPVVPQAAQLPQSAPLVPQAAQVAPAAPTLVPATSGSLTDYFKAKNVQLQPQHAQGFQAFNITLPMPTGWSQVPDPNVPDAFAVIADRSSPDLYSPNAQVVVYKLVGDFDPKDAITHGFIDSESLPAWQTTDLSLADFYGSPSSIIEGTYRQNDMTLNTSRRHVIVSAGHDRYLVSLAVTSMASRQGATTAAEATDAIVNGFRTTPNPSAPTP